MKHPHNRKKAAQYRHQQGRCWLCGSALTLDQMTKDHVQPLSKDGSPDWDNIRLACDACNARKADREMRVDAADDEFHAAWASKDDARIRQALLRIQNVISIHPPL